MSDYYSQDPPESLPLFDHGQHAKQTRADAFVASKAKLNERQLRLLAALAAADPTGLSRWEGTEVTGILYQSITGVFLSLLREGLAEDTEQRRPTPTGHMATVAVITDAGRQVLATRCTGGEQ